MATEADQSAEAVASGFRVGQFNIERVLKAFLPEAVPLRFSDLALPLKIIVTDYYGQTERVCESGDLYKALAASCALPAVFMPVKIDGRVMIDGGIYNPIPFDHLRGLADIVVAVDVVGGPDGDGETIPSRIDSLFGATQLMMQSIITMKMQAGAPIFSCVPMSDGSACSISCAPRNCLPPPAGPRTR